MTSNTSYHIVPALRLRNLHVSIDGKEVIKGLSLDMQLGEIHVLMGPNGSGKSTLAAALMGDPHHTVSGAATLFGHDLLALSADARAHAGLFLSFQHPIEIPGVTVESFLRLAYNENKKARDPRAKELSVLEFHKLLLSHMQLLHIDQSFARRYLNEGFSGGEKKRMEMLQMSILDPAVAILDEIDSGLDVDALRIVAAAIQRRADDHHATLIITHFSRITHLVPPTHVHILQDGVIARSGDAMLVLEIEKEGFGKK